VENVLTVSKLARAIGVSESSLKRWSDDGTLRVTRTAGGHRRIPLPEAVRFIRQIGAHVVRPDLLGLVDMDSTPEGFSTRTNPDEALYEALEQGRAAEVRGMIQSLYLSGWSLPQIFDGPLRGAMARLGELWLHAEWGIVVEHRATNIVIQALGQLRSLLPPHNPAAPVAVGSAGDQDSYILPSLMASLVMAEVGFTDVNLGPMTPTWVLRNACAYYRARVAWLSMSVAAHPERLHQDLEALALDLGTCGTRLVIGGRATESIRPAQVPGVIVARSMGELASLGAGLLTQIPPHEQVP
jgi:excisionase family DNA binding protein